MNATNYRCCQFFQCGVTDMCWPYFIFLGQVCICPVDLLPVSVAGALEQYCSASQILFSLTPARSQSNYNEFSEIVLATNQCKS